MIFIQPKVAVCLAAYNGTEYLASQLESILAQEQVDVRVFISVDRSDDGTEEFVGRFAAHESRIILLPFGSRFGGASSNFFRLLRDVDISSFDYLALSDQDDVWYPHKLRTAIEILGNKGADCYSSNVLAFWPNGREELIDKAQNQREFDFLFEAAGPGCTYVFKRIVGEHIGIFLRSNADLASSVGLHDWFFYAYARANGYRWVIDPLPSMAYRQHASNQVGVNSGLRAYRARVLKILGGWGISQARLIARLLGLENDSFCRPWRRPSRRGMIWLALNAYRTRRKVSDRFIFAAACLLLALVGDRSDE